MEAKRRVKLYKHGKTWLTMAVFALGIGAAGLSVPTFGVPAQIVQAATTNLVTATDANGNVSVDPANTAGGAVAITPTNAAAYFTAASRSGQQRTITGNTVQLTTGHETTYDDGVALMLANQQINFKSDFSLNLTMNIAYDADTMGGWVPGDGTALFFQPLDAATSLSTARTGYNLGITDSDLVGDTDLLSFNISSNAMGQVAGYPMNEWIIYESNKTLETPIDTPIAPGTPIGRSGSVSYTYDMSYVAATRTLTTRVSDSAGTLLQTWNYQVPASWSNTGYTMGVSASTAGSQGAYQAVLNSYAYTPAGTTMSIQSAGLPSGVEGYTQTGIAAIAGNVVAFYPEGETAPTTDDNGQPVTAAYAVPGVGPYVLKKTQFLTVGTTESANVATLQFGMPGTVHVNYFDPDGNVIKDPETLTGFSGDAYSTTVPDIEGYTFAGFSSDSVPLSGNFTGGWQTINIAYTRDMGGDLRVVYLGLDGTNGTVPHGSETYSGYLGQPYSIDPPKIDGYTYSGQDAGSAPLSGYFTADRQSMILIYTKDAVPAGGLMVNYVDENGLPIQRSTTQSGNVGDAYSVDTPDIDGYTYSKPATGSAALSGELTADAQSVTLVYTKNPVPAADVTVKYVDEAGRILKTATVQSGNIGDDYAVTPDDIAGYTYVGLGTDSAALTGPFSADAQTVTLVYKPNTEDTKPVKAENLTIKYVDEAGRTLQPDVVRSGYVGNGYEVGPDSIKGYTYVGLGDGSAALKGQLTSAAQTITLVYKPNTEDTKRVDAGDLTIKYVDEAGRTLQPNVVKSGYVGNGYEVMPDTLKGYTYVGLGNGSAALKGQLSAAAQTITLVYKSNAEDTPAVKAGDLTIKYVDEAGRTLQPSVVKSGHVGNGYEVTPDMLKGYTYVGLGDDSATLKGQLTAAAQTITLVYKTNAEDTPAVKAGALTIKYVDEAGRTLQPSVMKSGYVGNGYAVAPDTIKGYSYVGLGFGSAALKGQFGAAAQTITLVYKANVEDTTPAKAGNLTIKYVDESGCTVKTSVVKSGFLGNGYSVSPDAIKGYSYVGLGKDSAALKGQFSKAAQTITLVYKASKLTPTINTTGDSTGAKKQPAAKPVKKQLATKATKESRGLPQTGERTNHTLSQLGLIGLLSLMIVGIVRLRRRA